MPLAGYLCAEGITRQFRQADLPVPVFDLAESIDLPIDRHRFSSNICGFCSRFRGEYIVVVNSIHSDTRQRFSAAHELGHCLCHLESGVHRVFHCSTGDLLASKSLYERQANAFAAELLMPRRLIVEVLNTGCRKLSELAGLFYVSCEAMHWRLQTLRVDHDTDLDYVFWKTRGRHKAASSE